MWLYTSCKPHKKQSVLSVCILYPVCSLHFVPGLQSAFCTDRFASPLISQLSGSQILNYFASTGEVKVQRVLWFHSWGVTRFNERCTLGESLTASLLSFPTFFRNQQAVVGNLLKILVDLFWPRYFSTAGSWKENNVRGEILDRYLDTTSSTSKWRLLANKNI